jgi:spore maturation protein CgeB
MVAAGYSPSVRLFEAGACGAPLISDASAGLDTLFVPRREIVFAKTSHAVVQALTWPEERRAAIAHACQRRFLREHSSRHRAAELEHRLLSIMAVTGRELKPQAYRPQSEPKQGTYVSRQRVLT